MKKLGHYLKLTFDIAFNKTFEVFAFSFTKTFTVNTSKLMLGLQTDQNNVLLLILDFSVKLSQAIKVK